MRGVVVQTAHARNRSAARSRFQLSFAGAASTQGSSVTTHSRPGRPETAFAAVRQDVRESGPSLDSTGTVVARAAVADAVFGAQRAAADGRDRLQRSVSLVRGAESGRSGLGCDGVHQESQPFAGSGGGPGI